MCAHKWQMCRLYQELYETRPMFDAQNALLLVDELGSIIMKYDCQDVEPLHTMDRLWHMQF